MLIINLDIQNFYFDNTNIMKRIFISVIAIAAFVVLPLPVIGQVSSTVASVGADARIIAPISLGNDGSNRLNFGTISRSSASGSVTVSPDGVRTSSGGATVLASSLFSAAPFSVTGEKSATFSVSLPGNDVVVLTRVDGTETMEVTGFTHNSNLILSNTGSATFHIGATLNLDADQVSGDYHGSFSVTVNYQ